MIYLIRHGLTQANIENRFAGRSSEPLCSEGIDSIKALARELKPLGFTRIFTGPLPRTVQTAEIIAGSCGVEVEISPELNEIYLPHWDGLTKDEIKRRYGREYPTWLADPAGFKVPGCETLAAVQQRAVKLVSRITHEFPAENILLVTHLIVARCLVLHDRGLEIARFRSIKIANGRLVSLPGMTVQLSQSPLPATKKSS